MGSLRHVFPNHASTPLNFLVRVVLTVEDIAVWPMCIDLECVPGIPRNFAPVGRLSGKEAHSATERPYKGHRA